MPRFTGGAVGALSYDAIGAFEPSVPRPEKDPVGVPTAAFIETDLVLVFDHLSHTLSAIASLHTEAPDLDARYRIAERAIFEALERTARPSQAEMAAAFGRSSSTDGAAAQTAFREVDTWLGRDAYISAVEHAKDAIAAGEAIQVVLARRQSFDLPNAADGTPIDGIGLYRALRRVNPRPTCSSPGPRRSRSSAPAPSCCSRSMATEMTTHPIAGTRPRAPRRPTTTAGRRAPRDPKERAEHVMLVDLGRNDLGRVARPGP